MWLGSGPKKGTMMTPWTLASWRMSQRAGKAQDAPICPTVLFNLATYRKCRGQDKQPPFPLR